MTCLVGILSGFLALGGQPAAESNGPPEATVVAEGAVPAPEEPRLEEPTPRPDDERWKQRLTDPLQAGREIRLLSETTGPIWLKGKLLAVEDGRLLVRQHGEIDPLWVPRASLHRLEVRDGTRTNARDGAILGAAVGVLGALMAGASDEGGGDLTRGAQVVIQYALQGAFIGGLVRSPRWTRVPTFDLRAGVAPMPRGGATATLTLDF